ncbi:MAG: HAMP domain-containing sensor histidine kinase, partial [Desulfatirhabdiaceae bacterium]|nr:HAMP domain-containing sensor histidine kinase [Desulfatirhabdiaceae bacterium]
MPARTNTAQLIEDLEQIFSILRHEFGNTVNSLKMTLDVLVRNFDTFDDPAKLEFLHRALVLVARQHKFLDAMRAYVRTAVGEIEEIPLIFFWSDCVALAKSKLAGKQIGFKQKIQAEPYSIQANSSAIYQIIGHLMDNAIEAVSDIEAPEIELLAFTQRGSFVVQVLDNGPGIPAEIQPNLFTPFFTTREGHSGLGLAISRKMLTQMDGRLE